MNPPFRDNGSYETIMVRRNSGCKGWKTLIRSVRAVSNDAVQDREVRASHRAPTR
jgi:hypothetical protein